MEGEKQESFCLLLFFCMACGSLSKISLKFRQVCDAHLLFGIDYERKSIHSCIYNLILFSWADFPHYDCNIQHKSAMAMGLEHTEQVVSCVHVNCLTFQELDAGRFSVITFSACLLLSLTSRYIRGAHPLAHRSNPACRNPHAVILVAGE